MQKFLLIFFFINSYCPFYPLTANNDAGYYRVFYLTDLKLIAYYYFDPDKKIVTDDIHAFIYNDPLGHRVRTYRRNGIIFHIYHAKYAWNQAVTNWIALCLCCTCDFQQERENEVNILYLALSNSQINQSGIITITTLFIRKSYEILYEIIKINNIITIIFMTVEDFLQQYPNQNQWPLLLPNFILLSEQCNEFSKTILENILKLIQQYPTKQYTINIRNCEKILKTCPEFSRILTRPEFLQTVQIIDKQNNNSYVTPLKLPFSKDPTCATPGSTTDNGETGLLKYLPPATPRSQNPYNTPPVCNDFSTPQSKGLPSIDSPRLGRNHSAPPTCPQSPIPFYML